MISITNISKRMMGSCLLLMLFLAQSLTSFAQVELSMEDFTIASGETEEVSLMLTNDQTVTALQVSIDLPAGLEYVPESVAKTSRVKGRGAMVQASTQTGQLVIVATDGTIAAGEGAVVTFKVQADDNLDDCSKDVNLTDIFISGADATQLNKEESYTATVKMLGLDCKFTAPESIEVAANQEYQVDVNLTNVQTITALQGKLTLPEGLELVVPDEDEPNELFIYSDRIPLTTSFKFQKTENGYSFVLSSTMNSTIVGNDGVIFSFKVKAAATLPETSEITLTDLYAATTTGKSQLCDPVTISVTNNSELLWQDIQAQLAELKAQVDEAVAAVADNEVEIVKNAAAAATEAYDALEETLTAAHEAGTLEALDFNTEAQPTVDAIAAITTAVEQAAANDAKQAELASEIAALQEAVDAIEFTEEELLADDFATLTESKAAIQTAIDELAAWVEEQAAATALTAESVLPENTVAADTEALAAALEEAKAAKAAADQLAADKAAFDEFKAEQVAAIEALAEEGDSEASQAIIADAVAAIEALEYDEEKSLEENKAAAEEIAAPVAEALAEQRAAEQLAADKAAFDAYKAEQVAAVEALAEEGDSEAAQAIIADAVAAIEALEYDEEKSLEENKAAVEEIAAPVAEALAEQRAADQLAADKAAFEAYKAEQVAAVEALAEEGDSEASQQIIADAVAAIEALEYDEEKSLEENKAAVEEIAAPVAEALAEQRAADAILLGDVNGDGVVDLSDSIMVTYYSLHVAPANFNEAAADVNGDGQIDLSDAITIIYISLGVK